MTKQVWVIDFEAFDNFEIPQGILPVVFAEEDPSDPDEGIEYYHAPEFDRWAEVGDIPSKALIAHGWSMWADCCGHIDEMTLEDTGRSVDDVVGTLYTETFCDEECEAKVKARRRRRKAVETAGVLKAKADLHKLLKRSVEITGTHAYAKGDPPALEQVFIYFKFPGQGIGECSFDGESIRVPQGELENYYEWARG